MTDLPTSSTGTPWHVSPGNLDRYAHGRATPSQAASIEPHIAGCAACQAGLGAVMRAATPTVEDRLAVLLEELVDSVDQPAPSILERLLCRLGMPGHVARLVLATPAMQLSWLAAVATTLAFTVLATRSGGVDFGVFLMGAPLLPLVAVAAAFGVPNDTTAELTVTAPVRTSWLLLLRSMGVLATSLVLCGVAALALPSHGWENAAWVLPALALSSASAALSTWVRPLTAAVALTAGWFVVLAATAGPIARRLHAIDTRALVEHSAAFAPSGQLLAVVITLISLLVLFRRREVLDIRSLA